MPCPSKRSAQEISQQTTGNLSFIAIVDNEASSEEGKMMAMMKMKTNAPEDFIHYTS
jgi:hypothetical protein